MALGLGGHGLRPIRGVHLSTALPDEVTGGGLGLVRTLLMSVCTLAPVVVGFVADLMDFILAFGLLAVVATGAVLLAGLAILVNDRS